MNSEKISTTECCVMLANRVKVKRSLLSAVAAAVATVGMSATGMAQEADILIDGSSTVFPITEAVAEDFTDEERAAGVNPNDYEVAVGVSGTGGGFKKFCVKNGTDISGASRPIKQKEIDLCEKAEVEFIEIPVAYDALTVVVNKGSDITEMTVPELKKMWWDKNQDTVKKWSDVNSDWSDADLELFGPGTDSGTYDYFKEAILGKSKVTVDGKEKKVKNESRSDYLASEDDNVIVNGVKGSKNALGYFGFAYYLENQDTLKAVKIVPKTKEDEAAKPAVGPSVESVNNGSYSPLSRPIYIYVNTKSLKKDSVATFIKYYLDEALQEGNDSIVQEVGYVALPKNDWKSIRGRVDNKKFEPGVRLREGL